MSGASSLVLQLNAMHSLFVAIPKAALDATAAVDSYGGDHDPHGGDAVVDQRGGDTPSGGSSLHSTTGGGLTNKGGGGLPTGLRAGATFVAAQMAAVSKHVDDSVKKINDATKDVLQQLIDAVAVRDQAQAEALTYLRTRSTEFYNGNAQMMKVLNLMARWKDAQKSGDANEMSQALAQLYKEIKIMNDNLIGRGNTKGSFIDLDRLLGAGAADAASKISAAQSTGKAP